MEYSPLNMRKLVKKQQNWLENLYNVPLDPTNTLLCLSMHSERLFGTVAYFISDSIPSFLIMMPFLCHFISELG